MSHIVFECQGCDISQAPSGCGESRACNRSWTYDRQARSRSMQSKCGAGRFFQASSPGKSSSPGGGSTRISTRKTIIRCSLVQSSIVRIWGQAQGPLAAPLRDVLHSRVPLRAAPLPRHVVLVRDLEWPGATNDEARRKWLGMWLGTWFDAVFVGAGAPRSGAAPPWAFDCAVPPVEDLPPTIEGVHPAR